MISQLKTIILNIIHYINLIIGFPFILRYCFQLAGYKHFPIIVYHSVDGSDDDKDNISIDSFEKQLSFLTQNFKISRLIELPDLLKRGRNEAHAFITFDDARKSVYKNAHKIMVKHKIPYTVFIPSHYIGGVTEWADYPEEVMNIAELKELKKSGLVDFGSHTVNHISLGVVSKEEVKNQLIGSKEQLNKIFPDDDIEIFAYPYGGFDDFSINTSEMLAQCGYKMGLTTIPCVMNSINNLYTLHRIGLYDKDSKRKIKAKIYGKYNWEFIKDYITYRFRLLLLYLKN